MQHIFNELSKGWRAERSLSQMTLGRFIKELESLPKDKEIENICDPHSYRGYYSDLSFERKEGTQTVEELLNICKQCLGETFTGYKGGEFYMDEHTPLWIAEYGNCGDKIMNIIDGTILIIETKEDNLT